MLVIIMWFTEKTVKAHEYIKAMRLNLIVLLYHVIVPVNGMQVLILTGQFTRIIQI